MENIDNKHLSKELLEATTGADGAAIDIATTDQDLSVDTMYQQAALPSLGKQIFSVVQMEGPTAGLFNIKKHPTENKFVLLRNEAQVFESDPISTGLTQEVVQDIKSQYGKDSTQVIGTLLRGLSNAQENSRTLEFLEDNCLEVPDLDLTDSKSIETNMFEITQKVNELVLKANSLNMRTYEGFCVLPYFAGAAIAGLSNYVGGKEGEKDERGLFLAQIGQIKFYLNPDATSKTAYVGLKDSRNISKSSAVFGPFASQIVETMDPDSGELYYWIFNRFSITPSPLHEDGNEMLFKFDINVTV